MHWELRASGCEGALVSDEAQMWIALTPTAALGCGKTLFTGMIGMRIFMDIWDNLFCVDSKVNRRELVQSRPRVFVICKAPHRIRVLYLAPGLHF